MRARPDASRRRSSVTSGPIRRGTAAARSAHTRRAVKVSARMETVLAATGLMVRGRRVTEIVPAAIGPRENLTATGNSPAARGIASATPGIASATMAIEDRAGILVTARVVATAATRNLGRSAMIAADAIPARPATARAISTSRVRNAAARSVRGFRVRARIARNSTALAGSGPKAVRLAGASAQRVAIRPICRSAAPRQRGRQQGFRKTSGVRRPRRLSRAPA